MNSTMKLFLIFFFNKVDVSHMNGIKMLLQYINSKFVSYRV